MPDVSLGLAGSFSHGRVISELLAAPDSAVGQAFSYTVDGSYWERPVALAFKVTTGESDDLSDVQVSYTDADEIPLVTIETGPAVSADDHAFYSLAASWAGAAAWSNDTVNAALPPLLLQPTWMLKIILFGEVTDTVISNIRYYRERFITGDQGYLIGYQTDEGRKEHLLSVLSDLLA